MTSLKPKQIDLYQSFFEKPPRSRDEEKRIAIVLFPVILAAVMAGCWGLLRMDISMLDRQLAPVQTYLNTPDTQTLHQKADKLQKDKDALTALAETMKAVEAAVDSYPHLPEEMLSSVYSLAGDKVKIATLEYDGNAGILHISIIADRPESGQDYITRLRKTGSFTDISHKGYTDAAEEIYASLPSPPAKEVTP